METQSCYFLEMKELLDGLQISLVGYKEVKRALNLYQIHSDVMLMLWK